MEVKLDNQDDGSYVLRFESTNLRADIALTDFEIASLIELLQNRNHSSAYKPCNHIKWPWNNSTSKWCTVLECDNYASKH